MNTIVQITTDQFLTEIHGENAIIYFNVGNITWKYKPQAYSQAKKKLSRLNTDLKKDICYIVNSGGSKDKQITRINSAFADWDCGKGPDGNYFSIDIVKRKKTVFLSKLKEFQLGACRRTSWAQSLNKTA